MSDISEMNNPEALAQLLEGRSDDEINEFVQAAGIDTVLSQVFDAMKERLDPVCIRCEQDDQALSERS